MSKGYKTAILSLIPLFLPLYLPIFSGCGDEEKVGELPDHVPGEFVVKYRKEIDEKGMDGFVQKHNLRKIERFRELTLDRLGFDGDEDVRGKIERLKEEQEILYIEPNYIYYPYSTRPDDLNSLQWGLHNTGQSRGVEDADIDGPEAWDISTGSSDVVVAVVDSGVDYSHPDLQNNIWINPGEISGNGVDDDQNGYVDDIVGWDFVSQGNNPYDSLNHGTHLAGILGAVGNNGKGITGVNWNVKIMVLKFMSPYGGAMTGAVNGILYAVNNGAKVINASWGGPGYSSSLLDAISYANQEGVTFVTAAGNEGTNSDTTSNYPNNYSLPNIISVTASTRTDALASYSVYGRTTVDLAAPGSSIYSTLSGNSYGFEEGTSMAAPFVSGVAALLYSIDPSLTGSEVRDIIISTVDPISSHSGMTVSGGRLNAYNALSYLTGSSGGDGTGGEGGDNGGGGDSGGSTPTGSGWVQVSYPLSTSHRYSNNFDGSHTITQAGAINMKVHFSRFETEENYDFCILYDGSGAEVARYSGNLGSFESEIIPGDTLKIRFTSDYSIRGYGFDMDYYSYESGGEEMTEVAYSISSPHDYSNNYDEYWTIEHSGAEEMAVHFSRFETESGYDFVYIYDSSGKEAAKYDGTRSEFWSPSISGDTIYVKLVTDYSVTGYGFDIDKYRYR